MIVTRSRHWIVFVALIGLVMGLQGFSLQAQEPDDFSEEGAEKTHRGAPLFAIGPSERV